MAESVLFQPGRIGPVETTNRIVRAGTSETASGDGGEITDNLVEIYENLARNRVGLILSGHMFCHPRGRYATRQTGIHDDAMVPGLTRLTSAVHRHGGKVFAQLAHAGSQSRVPENRPLAPSPVPNALTGRMVEAATAVEIAEVIEAFAGGARRALRAGFDGVHIHAANGYLISEFSSALTNRREDEWGGTARARDRFVLEVLKAVRREVPAGMAVTVKLGLQDAVPGGMALDEGVRRGEALAAAGADAIEVSCNAMRLPSDSAWQSAQAAPCATCCFTACCRRLTLRLTSCLRRGSCASARGCRSSSWVGCACPRPWRRSSSVARRTSSRWRGPSSASPTWS